MRMAAWLKPAFFGQFAKFWETVAELAGGNTRDAEFAHARRVDDKTAAFEREQTRSGRRVAAALALLAEFPRRKLNAGKELVEQRGFADSAVA